MEEKLKDDIFFTFISRMKKLGIEIELVGNYPWVYLHKVNGNLVRERFFSDHCFTLGYMPVRVYQKRTFTDISKIIKTVRKYRYGK